MSKQTKNTGKQKEVITGTVVGAIVGATASLLLAPKPGKEIRTDITNKVESGKEKTKQFNDKTRVKLDDLKNNSKQVSRKNSENSASYTSRHPGELHSEKMADAQGDNKQQSETTKPKSTSSKKTTSENSKASSPAKKSNSSTQSKKQTAAK